MGIAQVHGLGERALELEEERLRQLAGPSRR